MSPDSSPTIPAYRSPYRTNLERLGDLVLLLVGGPPLLVLWLCFELVMLVGWFPILLTIMLGWAGRQAWEHRADAMGQSIQVKVGE